MGNIKGFVSLIIILIVVAAVGVTGVVVWNATRDNEDTVKTETTSQELTEEIAGVEEEQEIVADEEEIAPMNVNREEVVADCKVRQELSGGDLPVFDCDDIVFVSETGEFAVFEVDDIWVLARLAEGSWHMAIAIPKNGTLNICEASSPMPVFGEYCAL